ncbi:MAG TPA: hypothetical protein PLB19_01335 [Candidatus Paceibacterota bacterium]|nr:hypothetical protein [Candidatus Paceibacterota bacterium]HPQ22933.1 hypothetical protein [Candidatus Paceibacterota bacterium]
MSKKITISIIVIALLLIGGGVYWWWQSKVELQELNKNLPQGIRVERRNNQEVVVNTLDGYEIKVPKEWGGLENVEYLDKESGLTLKSKNTEDWVLINSYENSYEIENSKSNLNDWLNIHFKEQPLFFPESITSIFGEENIKNYHIIKVKTDDPLIGTHFFYYFQQNSKIYEIYTDYSEESIREVILNGNF